MRRQHHIIYVPGILDDIYHGQSTLVKLWEVHGVHGHCHEMPWEGPEPFEPKLQRLLDQIDGYRAEGHTVSLVGASAGASGILNAYAKRKDDLHSLVYICAKINTPETVSKKIYGRNPAFKTSMEVLQKNLPKLTPADKAKMHSFYSPSDGTVPYEATVIPGVAESRLPALRHGKAILYSLSFGAPKLLSALREPGKL